jgi:hypothetical protein
MLGSLLAFWFDGRNARTGPALAGEIQSDGCGDLPGREINSQLLFDIKLWHTQQTWAGQNESPAGADWAAEEPH